jgi:predicted kinase
VVLRSDEIRKRRYNAPPEQRLPRSAYKPAASRAVFAELAAEVAEAASAGHAALADATFMDPRHRQAVQQAAGAVRFVGLWLQAPMHVLEARVAGRQGDASDADLAVLRNVAKGDPGAGDWIAVDTTDGPAALRTVTAALAANLC